MSENNDMTMREGNDGTCENVPPSPSPEEPPQAPHDPADPGPQGGMSERLQGGSRANITKERAVTPY